MALQLRKGHTSSFGKMIATSFAVLALIAQPLVAVNVPSAFALSGTEDVTTQQQLINALADTSVNKINLYLSQPTTQQIVVNRSVEFNGGSLVGGWNTGGNGNDAVLLITGVGTIFKATSLTVDGGGASRGLQGIQVYGGAQATFNDLAVKNSAKSGLHINGSTATVNNFTTSGNGGWYGAALVDQGSGVTTPSKLTITGQSHHVGEGFSIYDVRTENNGVIDDQSGQYDHPYNSPVLFKLKSAPVAPTFISPTPSEGQTINTGTATIAWTKPAYAHSVNYSVDGVIKNTVDTGIGGDMVTLSGLSLGLHTIKLQSQALSGLTGDWSAERAFIVTDNTPPSTMDITYNGGVVNGGMRYIKSIDDLSFTADITDDFGVARATYRITNIAQPGVEACGNWNAGSITNYNFSSPLQTSASYTVAGSTIKNCDPSMKWKNGSVYSIVHAAYDAANNEYKVNGGPFTIDKSAPTLSNFKMFVDRHDGNGFVESNFVKTNDTVKLNVDAADNGGAGMRGVDFGVSGVSGGTIVGLNTTGLNPKATTPVNGNTYEYTFTVPANYIDTHNPVAEGLNQLQIRVRGWDNLGNYGKSATDTGYLIHKFTIDNTAPSVPTLMSPSDNAFLNGASITQSWSGNPADTDISQFIYESCNDALCNSHRWGNGANGGEGVYTASQTSKTATNVGTAVYWWRVKAVDHAGNISGWSPIWKITVDNTPPPAPTATFMPNANGTQAVTLSDTEAGVSYRYTTDGTDPRTSSTAQNGTTFNITPAVAPAVLTIKAIAVDAAGNVSSVYTVAGPSITNQASQTATTSAITLVWTTGTPATSRVVYDTVPHAVLGSDANYGYAFSTVEDTTKTTNHSVTITGLTPGTTYYFRIVSHGSPTTVSPEITSLTLDEQLTQQNGGRPTFRVNPPQTNPVVAVAQTGDQAVLGDETITGNNTQNTPSADNTNDDKDVKGAEDVKGDDATSPLGVAWYWWVLALAAVATGIWWLIAARKRRKDEDK